MKRMLCAGAAATLLVAVAATSHAQQDIQWKQTINLPKGLNLPKDIIADILGIQFGDTYAEAKPKLEKLLAEVRPAAPTAAPAAPNRPLTMGEIEAQRLRTLEGLERESANQIAGVNTAPPLTETRTQIRLQAPTGYVTASFVGTATLRRSLPGATSQKIDDTIRVLFSAPSSGHQVYAVDRFIAYNQADQPRVGELIARLKEKFGGDPQTWVAASTGTYKFQFNDGRLHAPPGALQVSCLPFTGADTNQAALREINRNGDCDVVLMVEVRYGISKDHAATIRFAFADNERAKANLGADFAYFQSYVESLRGQTKGAQPKL
ncbi:MAG: hypothetical protein QOI12_161 [Alphaproteobacteria bacterium]|jgi:hypothetical protein|nr:hypothetical protein [Alphaproteobacteria bacterium]